MVLAVAVASLRRILASLLQERRNGRTPARSQEQAVGRKARGELQKGMQNALDVETAGRRHGEDLLKAQASGESAVMWPLRRVARLDFVLSAAFLVVCPLSTILAEFVGPVSSQQFRCVSCECPLRVSYFCHSSRQPSLRRPVSGRSCFP